MKKSISIFLIIAILCSVTGVVAGAKSLITRPYADYYSVQNPPDFSWPYTKGATYSLRVAKNKTMTLGKKEITGLTKNLYNFSEEFEPGEYWWSYKTNSGAWSTPSRFYIAENATGYAIDMDYDNISLNLPSEHPRLLLTRENLEYLKKGMISDDSYRKLRQDVELDINSGYPVAPTVIYQSQMSSKYSGETFAALEGALLYMMSGNERYKEYTIGMLNTLSAVDENGKIIWAPENIINPDSEGKIFNPTTDVYFVLAAYNLGLCYDWLYNDLTINERTNIVNLMESILKHPCEDWTQDVAAQSRNLYMGFTGAHNYRLNQGIIASLAIYEDVGTDSAAHRIIKRHLPIMINFTSPFTYQDGGNAQGNFYGVGAELGTVHKTLADLGIVDITKKAAVRNQVYRYIYNWNAGELAVFGDGYNDPTSSYHYGNDVQRITSETDNPVMAGVNKWLLEDSMNGYDFYNYNHIGSFLFNEKVRDIKPIEPYMLPTAKYFKDIGWISLNSDLSDKKRISLKFKSSPYGSYNHSHPDQNSFIINAFGEYMLTDADYYDAMHSTFDLAWNKKTYAHNAITYNNGKGQPYNDSRATGEVTAFINHPAFDLAAGDATTAYNVGAQNLSKAERNIIYLKPDVFIVLDNLKSTSGTKSFEFWLNTRGVIDDIEDGSATVTKNDVTMYTECVYPEVTAKTYINTYNGPDGTVIDSSALTVNSVKRDADANEDSRICYITGETDETKMINVLSFAENGLNPVAVRTTEEDGFVVLTVTDRETREKTYVYIRTEGSGKIVYDDVVVNGDAAVVSPDGSAMLINGTLLEVSGEKLIESDRACTVAMGNGRVSVSSLFADASVNVLTGNINQIHKTEDEREVKLTEGKKEYGIKYTCSGEYTNFAIFPGAYTLSLNDTLHEGYVKLDVASSAGGSIKGTDRRIIGTDAEFELVPDSGYVLSSVTLNGEELKVNNENKFTVPVASEGGSIYAEFVPVKAAEPSVSTAEEAFSLATPDGMEFTVFGRFINRGLKAEEFGILYSSVDKDFTIGDTGVKKLSFDTDKKLNGNSFGIQIKDKRASIGNAYARAYMRLGGEIYYGNRIKLNGKFGSEVPLISEMKIKGAKLSPAFSPDIFNYVFSTESGTFSESDTELSLAPGAEAVFDTTDEGVEVTVTAENGRKEKYSFRYEAEKSASGKTVATENTVISIRGTERDKDVFAETNGNESLMLYQYRLDRVNSKDVLVRFDISGINPYAEKIKLSMTFANVNQTHSGYKAAVYDAKCDEAISLNGLTYTNSYGGRGSFEDTEKVATFIWDEHNNYNFTEDITDYIKRKYAAGEKIITLHLRADDTAWADDFKGDKLVILYFRSNKYGVEKHRPAIIWEGE